jgi:hypothetical protein
MMNFGYRVTFQLIDKGNIEVSAASGVPFSLQTLSQRASKQQTGFVSNYTLVFTLVAFLIPLVLSSFLSSSLMDSVILLLVCYGFTTFVL